MTEQEPEKEQETVITETDSQKEEKKTFLKSLSIVAYLRELSIVIIGVLVTLVITNSFNSYSRQKEIKGILIQVKEEMKEHLTKLEWNQLRWEGEQHIFNLLQQHKNNLNTIPADTLAHYSYAIGAIYSPSFINDSYELLKSSMYIQYIKDKELLRRLAELYRELGGLSRQLSTYSAQKESIFLHPMMEKMGPDNAAIWSSENPTDFFSYSLQEEGFNKFIYVGATILSPSSIFEDNKKNLREVIQLMNKAGY